MTTLLDSSSRFAAGAKPVSAATLFLPGFDRITQEVQQNLDTHVLASWYPRSIDEKNGGFFQTYGEDWTISPSADEQNRRSIVYQSRLTWVAAEVALTDKKRSAQYLRYVRHGLAELANDLWDKDRGGFYWEIDARTKKPGDGVGEKHAYGNSFGIYAAATAYRATGDTSAREQAKRAFTWLEKHAHDDANGGYHEALSREGKPLLTSRGPGKNDFIGTGYGYKSMNTHIHLLEALAALHGVAPDAGVRARLEEVFTLVRDKITVEPGCMNLYFTPDWRAVPDHDSFGHDVETAYLLVEAARELSVPDDERTWKVARSLVDHALDYGWDEAHGGFYDAGSAFGAPTVTEKVWWTQAEGLNALLLMHERYGKETPRYGEMFVQQWEFIKNRQIDYRTGGWIGSVEADGTMPVGRNKSDAWTDPYHQGRALMNVLARLRSMANTVGKE